MHIAIDLTSPLAARPSGMFALVKSYLRSLHSIPHSSVHVTLLTSSSASAQEIYRPFVGGAVELVETDNPAQTAHRFDAVHYPFNTLTFEPGNTPAIVTIHDLIPEHFPDQFDPVVLKRMRYACKRAAVVITDSLFTRADVINRYRVRPERVQCVYGTVDPVFYAPISDLQRQQVREKYKLPKRFLFYPAAARPHKNHGALLAALQWVDPAVSLVLTTGETHLPERFQQLRHTFPAERVSGLGHIEQTDLPILYALAEAVVIPSLAEGFGYPALEALTAGTPLIHSNTMSLAEIAGDAGLICNPYDPHDIAEKVNHVLHDQNLRQQMIQMGSIQAQTFNDNRTGDALLSAYQQVRRKSAPAKTNRPQVAFDVWRLTYVQARGLRPTGITEYVQAMFDLLHESDEIDLIPVIYPDPTDNHVFQLERAINDKDFWYGRSIAQSWNSVDPAHLRLARRTLEAIIQKIPHTTRGKYRLQQWKKNFEPHKHQLRQFDVHTHWKLYHSPVNALPSHALAGGTKRLLTVHDCAYIMFPEFWQQNTIPPIQYALDSIDPQIDYVVCDSEATRQDVLKLVTIEPDKVFTIHLAADPLFNTPQIARAKAVLNERGIIPGKYVLMLAQPEPRKNLIRQVRAFHTLHTDERFDTLQLVLISANANTGKQLEAQLQKEGLFTNSLHIITDADSGLLSGLYAEAALFLYASLYEGFGIPVLEAMMAGCPVVTSPVSSLLEVGGKAVVYVEPHDSAAIADGIIRILDDEDLRNKLIEAGKQHASTFTWEQTAAKTIDLYKNILKA